MVDKTLNGKLREWDELRSQIESLQSKMDKIKAEVKAEMDERKITTYTYSNLKVDMVHKVQPKMDKPALIAFLAKTEKYKGMSVVPDDFYGKPTISDYPQLKENK